MNIALILENNVKRHISRKKIPSKKQSPIEFQTTAFIGLKIRQKGNIFKVILNGNYKTL